MICRYLVCMNIYRASNASENNNVNVVNQVETVIWLDLQRATYHARK